MRRAIVRADGSSRLGMGHIMRGLAFAEGVGGHGVRTVFVTKALERCVADLIQSRGCEVEEIPSTVTWEKDALLTREIADGNDAKLVVTDLCHRASLESRAELETYHQSLKRDFFLLILAGGDVVDLPGNVVVSPYFRVTYPNAMADGERLHLLGPSYFIFRREFITAARAPRTIAEEARRVLVTIGGSDGLHLTERVVRALCVLPDGGLSLRIVFGPAYTDGLRREVTDLLGTFSGEYTLLDHDTNMAEAMLWADLAITGDGLTKYETAVTGTPSIMLSRFGSEKSLNEEFARAGTTLYLGDGELIDVGVLADQIQRALRNASLRTLMSERGKTMVDGAGLERILAKIPSGVLG